MARIAAAAAFYFVLVMAAGFVLGPVRVLGLEPRVGEFWAVLIEAPFLLAVIAAAAHWVAGKFAMRREPGALIAIGLGALALTVIAELLIGQALRGVSPAAYIARFTTPPGLVYGALLVVYAVAPLTLSRISATRGRDGRA